MRHYLIVVAMICVCCGVSIGQTTEFTYQGNASNEIANCSSSIRYKQNVNSFTQGLALIKKLRPVSFNWRADNQADLGLVAEEVAKAEPLFTTVNDKGEIEGVKYDRLGVVLINAVQEQQTQIESQQKQIDEQNQLIILQKEKLDIAEKQVNQQRSKLEAFKTLVCSQNPYAELCKRRN